jgi:hypothetical protein
MASDSHGSKAKSGLKPFRPGQSGNPGGRPKLPDFFRERGPEALKEILRIATEGEGKLQMQALIYVADRIYGKAVQGVEVETGEGVNGMLAALLALKGTKEGG